MNYVKRMKAALLIVMLVFTGCAQTGLRIGNTVTLCCPGNYADYDAYRLQTENMPIFLRDWIVDMFDTAFQEHGMERNDQVNDLIVTLTYQHVNLDPETEDINPFIRQESIDVELRYIAVVNVSMRETRTGEEVWAGQISRIHTVSPGEYMHEGNARVAFLETFRDLLSNYPGRD
ncbi:MAG: DUF4136 domain-containing protein [Gammaproteobacteria bacterium]|nr:hypothetical protein [Pseudomonadales bacterium]MCP5345408.1 hypothetical protein [Pseudomonadales bacterium]